MPTFTGQYLFPAQGPAYMPWTTTTMAMMRVADAGGADQGEQKVRTNNRPRRIIVNAHGLRPRRSHALAGTNQKDPRWRFVQLPPHHPALRFSGTLAQPQTAEEKERKGRRRQTGSLYSRMHALGLVVAFSTSRPLSS